MENYQTEDGLKIPECLQRYLPEGLTFIPYNDKKVKEWHKNLEKAAKEAESKNKKGGKGKGKGDAAPADGAKKEEPKKDK